MPLPHSPNQNHLLAALPAEEFERLAPHLEVVPMLLGETLYEPGGKSCKEKRPSESVLVRP